MPKVTYVAHDGSSLTVDVPVNYSVMEGATNNGVPGIIGICGGGCACATCHVYVDESFLSSLPDITETESLLLDTTTDRRNNSRLSCQITMTNDLDGLVVHTPVSQDA